MRELPHWDDFVKSASGGLVPAAQRGDAWMAGGHRHGGAAGAVIHRRWGGSEAVLAAGSLITVASLLVAAWLMRPLANGIDASVIRDAIARAPAADVYRAVQSIANSGVDRRPTPDEERIQRITRNRVALAVAVGLLGGVGFLAAIGAAVSIAVRRRLGGPHAHELRARSGP